MTQIIYLALFLGQFIFAGVVYYLISSNQGIENQGENMDFFQYLVPIVMISAIGMGYFLYRNKLQQVNEMQELSEKMNHYRVNNIIRWAFLEAANLFAIVVTLITSNLYFIVFFGLGIVVFFLTRPTLDNFIKEYSLSFDEQKLLS